MDTLVQLVCVHAASDDLPEHVHRRITCAELHEQCVFILKQELLSLELQTWYFVPRPTVSPPDQNAIKALFVVFSLFQCSR
jgi:hypothetical protein